MKGHTYKEPHIAGFPESSEVHCPISNESVLANIGQRKPWKYLGGGMDTTKIWTLLKTDIKIQCSATCNFVITKALGSYVTVITIHFRGCTYITKNIFC